MKKRKRTKRTKNNFFYPVAEPVFSGNELKYVTNAVSSGWISSVGKYVTEFEDKFARFVGTKYAVSCSNGTAALHLALLAARIGSGDEVIVPSLTYIATANAVRYVGATPVFVDIEPTYWQMDPAKISRVVTKRTKAIIPVHLYGHPVKMDDLMRVARKYKLFVIEDAAEAHGAEVKGKRVGVWGDCATFSFYGNKIITTGEGGMVVTQDRKFAERVKLLRGQGVSPAERYRHEVLGYNYRLTNVQAAIGLAQLERVDTILKKKAQIARWYHTHLKGIRGISLPQEAPWAKHVYWMYSILVDPKVIGKTRDEVMAALHKEGVETRPFFPSIHMQPIYDSHHHLRLPYSESLSARGINLPSSAKLTREDVEEIAARLKAVLTSV